MTAEKIRIAFTMIGGRSWTGGYNYLLNLLHVITQYQSDVLQPVLFIGTDLDKEYLRSFESVDGLRIVTAECMNASRRSIALINSIFLGSDPPTRNLFLRHGIDVVFENAQFHGAKLGIPTIAWMPDFQHRELPYLFSRAAWWRRELGFRAQISGGRTIMLSSYDARKTCEFYYPKTVGRTHIVRFAVPSLTRPGVNEVREVRDAYHLPEDFFYLPNQFWRHKNHLLVIEALASLNQAGYAFTVAASGRQLDPNSPDFFEKIVSKISSRGLSDQFRLLGLIPYEHVAPLMVGCTALLNPSLFEGWSTTVEEAKALNVPMVLSDLAVHKEQATGMALFFDRDSVDSLSNALLSAWKNKDTVISNDAALAQEPLGLAERFAEDFAKLVCGVV
ncbi:MAG: glycosyltransferase [Alphaproteobacteria bacterium]|nr:glycosyltransferase [Alphaproteobacteria bacterium]